MKLRYDFNPNQKTYSTFPQKVVQSTGLLDRFSFLKWCCPFCLEKPRPQSRKGSGVPVIRITRPRSPDSDLDSDGEDEPLRRGSIGSAGSAGSSGSLSRCTRGVRGGEDGGGDHVGDDVISLESSLGSGELDIINEEMDEARDYDSESIESKESLRSKKSTHSKTSKTSSAKEKTSVRDRISWRSKDKGASIDSRKSSKESLRSSRDSVKDKESHGEKSRSPMKKLMKHLKRTSSTPNTAVVRSGDKRGASVRGSDASLEDGGDKGGGKGGGRKVGSKFSFGSPGKEWRTRSATVDNRSKTLGRDGKMATGGIRSTTTGEVISQDVATAKSATLDGKTRKASLDDGKIQEEETIVLRSSNKTNNDGVDGNEIELKEKSSHANAVEAKIKGKREGMIFSHVTNTVEKEGMPLANTEPQTLPPKRTRKANPMAAEDDDDDDDDDEEDDEVFNTTKKSFRKDSGRETGSEMGLGDLEGRRPNEGESVYGSPPVRDKKDMGRGNHNNKTCNEVKRGRHSSGTGGRKHYVDEGEEGGGETTESSPPETPAAAKERVYDSSSTKPSSGFEDESTGSLEDGLGQKSGSPSPLVGSVGRTSGRESVASLASSTDNSTVTHPDEDIERLMLISEKKRNSLTPLGSRSESMASVCSAGAEGRYGTVIIKGEIELGLQYNYKEGQLECHVVQCRELAAVDTKRNRSDPYVKVYLLPDKSKSGKRKTKVKRHTLNPMFEEVLRFSTTMSELDSRTLWVSVWHSDMFGRNDFLGEVIIALADTVFDDVTPKWYPLQDRSEPMEEMSYSPRGDLIMALKFVPPDAVSSKKARRSRGALHVLVKEAKSLAAARPHGTADPICKGLLLPEKGKASKQKTSVCRKTLNPTWNHTLVFDDTSLQELTERALELSVWDHDRLGTSQFLGGCRLNLGKGKHAGRPVEWMEAAGMEVKLWEQMLERPNLWVEGSIMLRPTMDKPIYSSSMTE